MIQLPIQIGLSVIAFTHIWLLNDLMPPAAQKFHAVGNLAAAAMIAYGVYY